MARIANDTDEVIVDFNSFDDKFYWLQIHFPSIQKENIVLKIENNSLYFDFRTINKNEEKIICFAAGTGIDRIGTGRLRCVLCP